MPKHELKEYIKIYNEEFEFISMLGSKREMESIIPMSAAMDSNTAMHE